MAENKMFCFQCQETAKGTGCTIKGVCGKEATTSKWQDLLLSVVRGIGTIQHRQRADTRGNPFPHGCTLHHHYQRQLQRPGYPTKGR